MKNPFKFLAVLVVTLAAIAAIAIMAVRYMDVLQRQFDFFKGLLARRRNGVPDCCDDDYMDDLDDDSTPESVLEDDTTYAPTELKF